VSPTCVQDVSCLATVRLGRSSGRLGQPRSTHCVQCAPMREESRSLPQPPKQPPSFSSVQHIHDTCEAHRLRSEPPTTIPQPPRDRSNLSESASTSPWHSKLLRGLLGVCVGMLRTTLAMAAWCVEPVGVPSAEPRYAVACTRDRSLNVLVWFLVDRVGPCKVYTRPSEVCVGPLKMPRRLFGVHAEPLKVPWVYLGDAWNLFRCPSRYRNMESSVCGIYEQDPMVA
jgi:hypothetical protein